MENIPEEHEIHVFIVSRPSSIEYVFSGHGIHDTCPFVGLYVPFGQFKQLLASVAPTDALNVPVGHGVQSPVEISTHDPAGHMMQYGSGEGSIGSTSACVPNDLPPICARMAAVTDNICVVLNSSFHINNEFSSQFAFNI
jgi:hypothetical protein